MPQGERPRSEPEIIPPEQAGTRRTNAFAEAHGTERVYVARLGPIGIILVVLITAILSATALVLLLGALLIWLPLLVLFIAGAVIAAILRGYFTRAP